MLAVADEEVPTMPSRARGLEVDLVVAAGDLPWDYIETLVSIVGVPAAFVPGNHDPLVTPRTPGPRGTVNIDGRVVDLGGLRLGGLGGCVRYNAGNHQYTQDDYRVRADRLLALAHADDDRPVDVLLTHAPPRGLGDDDDPSHLGIEALHDVLDRLEPSWHLHGHIHPYGMLKPDRQVGRTTLRNVIPWQVLDVEPRQVRVEQPSAGSRA